MTLRIKPDMNPKPKTKPRKRALYYNIIGKAEEEKSIYCFRFHNTDKREIENITGIIYERVQKPLEVVLNINGKISNLYYRILCIDTHNTSIDLVRLKELYNGSLIKDKRLYPRDNIENYVVGEIKKEEEIMD